MDMLKAVNRRRCLQQLLAVSAVSLCSGVLAACGGAVTSSVSGGTTATGTISLSSTTALRSTAAPTPSAASTTASVSAPPAATSSVKAAAQLVTYMNWFTAQLPGGLAQKPLLAQLAKDEPNTQVNNQPTPGGNAYYQKLLTMMAGDVAPDVFTVALVEMAPLQAKQVLAPLDKFASQAGNGGLDKQDIVPGVLEAASLGGSLYGLPMNLDTQGLYYNKDLFAKAGVGTPTADWTWDGEWLQAAQKLTSGTGATKQFGTFLPPWQVRIWADGGDILSKDNKHCTLDQAVATQAIQDLADVRFKYSAAPTTADLSTMNNNDLFNTGRLAMNYSQSSQIGRLVETWKTKVPWDVAPLPKGRAGPANWMTFTALGITRTTKAPDAAWTMARYLIAPESVKTWVQLVSWVFMYKSTVNILSPLFKPGQAQLFLDAATVAHTEPRIPTYSQVLDTITKELDVVLNEGKETAQTAGVRITSAVNPLL